jgi:hypothetical protein
MCVSVYTIEVHGLGTRGPPLCYVFVFRNIPARTEIYQREVLDYLIYTLSRRVPVFLGGLHGCD